MAYQYRPGKWVVCRTHKDGTTEWLQVVVFKHKWVGKREDATIFDTEEAAAMEIRKVAMSADHPFVFRRAAVA